MWKLESPSPKDALCHAFGWNWSGNFGEDFKICQYTIKYVQFKIFQCIFAISLLSQPGKGRGHSIKHNWIPLYPKMLGDKFGWNWASGSWEDENVKS